MACWKAKFDGHLTREADVQFVGVAGMGACPMTGAGQGTCSTVHFLFAAVNIVLMLSILA